MRIGLEDLVEEKLANAQSSVDIAEIQRSIIERAARVCLVDEVHVIARHLLRRGSEVVEMEVGDAPRPIGIDFWHIHPRDKRTSEGIEQTLGWFVNLGHAQNIVDVRNDGEAVRWDKIGCCIAVDVTFCIHVHALDVARGVAVLKAGAIDWDEGIEIAFRGSGIWEIDCLIPTGWCYSSSTALFTRSPSCRCRAKIESHILVTLLDYEYLGGEVPSL